MVKIIPGISPEDFSYMEQCYERVLHKGINDSSSQFVSKVYGGIRRVYLDNLLLNVSHGDYRVKNPNFNQYVFDEVHGLGLRREKDLPPETKEFVWTSEGRDEMKKEVLELIIKHAVWLRQIELNGILNVDDPYHDYRCDLQSWLNSQSQ